MRFAISVLLGSLVISNAAVAGLVPLSQNRRVEAFYVEPAQSEDAVGFQDFDAYVRNLSASSAQQKSTIRPDGIEGFLAADAGGAASSARSALSVSFLLESTETLALHADGYSNDQGRESEGYSFVELFGLRGSIVRHVPLIDRPFDQTFSLSPGEYYLYAEAKGGYGALGSFGSGAVNFALKIVPEPSPLILATLAGLGLVAMRVRSKR